MLAYSLTITLTVEAGTAFIKLKKTLYLEPALTSPDFSKSITIYKSTAEVGLGVVLLQTFNVEEHLICFLS